MSEIGPLNIEQIKEFLPHRYPFLMVDRIRQIQVTRAVPKDPEPKDLIGTKVLGAKNLSAADPVFLGHFPGFAVYPGVLVTEAVAQVSAFCLYPTVEGSPSTFPKRYRFFLSGIDKARFRKPVFPGDCLEIATEFVKAKSTLCVFSATVKVQDQKVAEVDIFANIMKRETDRQ